VGQLQVDSADLEEVDEQKDINAELRAQVESLETETADLLLECQKWKHEAEVETGTANAACAEVERLENKVHLLEESSATQQAELQRLEAALQTASIRASEQQEMLEECCYLHPVCRHGRQRPEGSAGTRRDTHPGLTSWEIDQATIAKLNRQLEDLQGKWADNPYSPSTAQARPHPGLRPVLGDTSDVFDIFGDDHQVPTPQRATHQDLQQQRRLQQQYAQQLYTQNQQQYNEGSEQRSPSSAVWASHRPSRHDRRPSTAGRTLRTSMPAEPIMVQRDAASMGLGRPVTAGSVMRGSRHNRKDGGNLEIQLPSTWDHSTRIATLQGRYL